MSGTRWIVVAVIGIWLQLLYGCIAKEIDEDVAPVQGEAILARGLRTDIMIEPVDDFEFVIRSSTGASRCLIRTDTAAAWAEVILTVSRGEPQLRKELALDPNRYIDGCTVAVTRELANEKGFHIWYVDDRDELSAVARDLRNLLDLCGSSVRFELLPERVYGGG